MVVDKATKALFSNELNLVRNMITKEFETIPSKHRQLYLKQFQTSGKMIRPTTNILIAKTINKACGYYGNDTNRNHSNSDASHTQLSIAAFSEMIHTASLVHDDIIDNARTRRNTNSLGVEYGFLPATMAGDHIIGVAANSLAKLNQPTVISYLTQVILDLVEGELLQLKNSFNPNHTAIDSYLQICYLKTASLFANSFKATAYAACNDQPHLHQLAYDFGKYFGIAFQLIDDILDYDTCTDQLGKPTGNDIRLGLYTAPLIFASKQVSELNGYLTLLRKLMSNKATTDDINGYCKQIIELVVKSDGIMLTKKAAKELINKGMSSLMKIGHNEYVDALSTISVDYIDRKC